MSDLATLSQRLEAHLPDLRRQMAGGDWETFAALLAEAAPLFESALDDPRARLKAFYQLESALGQFEATRRILPPPGGALVEPAPSPPPTQELVADLPPGAVTQKEPDPAELLRRLTAICRDPNAAARLEADEGFYRARVRQAEMALAALQVRTEVERARLEQAEDRRDRRRNLLLGFIAAVLALGQVLSDAAVAELLGRAVGVAPTALSAWEVLLAKLGLVLGVGGLVAGVMAGLGRLRR